MHLYSIFTLVIPVSLFLLSHFSRCLPPPSNTPPPLPTLAVLIQFHPQRWRADSYNYPSVCEMNHWAADWAAWWETSILSRATECSQPSTSSLCRCPGLARVHAQCHCWEEQGVVCSRCVLWQKPSQLRGMCWSSAELHKLDYLCDDCFTKMVIKVLTAIHVCLLFKGTLRLQDNLGQLYWPIVMTLTKLTIWMVVKIKEHFLIIKIM